MRKTPKTAREAMLQSSEEDFQATVIQVAQALGWKVYHTHDSRGSNEGFPDLVLVRRMHFLVVELKTEQGELSQAQTEWIEALEKANVDVRVWRPSNWPQIHKVLT